MRCKDTIKNGLFLLIFCFFLPLSLRGIEDVSMIMKMMIIYPDMCLCCMKAGICCLLMVRKVNKMFYISDINS